MKIVQWLTILMTALLCSGHSNERTWVIDSKSKLAIHGSTNVNSFTCNVTSYTRNDTLRYFKNYAAGELQFTTNRMSIPISAFNCGSKQISRDFRRTLKSDSYPQLEIDFISLQGLSSSADSVLNSVLEITLAGVTTRYNMRLNMNVKNGVMFLSGIQRVKFADFKLAAPEKFKGLIRVKEILHVDFQLVLKEV
jgi:hypothetical protein